MPRALRVVAIVVLVVFLTSAAALIWLARRGPASDPGEARRELPDLKIPPFSLVDQDGRPFTRDSLLGQVTVLDAIFTNCPLACPVMTERMAGLADDLDDTPVRFLSISIDPRHDTPARLREYAQLHEADLSRWTFLTGDEATVRSVVVDGLKAALEEDTSRPITTSTGEQMYNILHPTWFFLVGPDAEVVDLYRSDDNNEMRRLAADARRLATALKAPPAGKR